MELDEYMSQKSTLQQQAAYVDFCDVINESFFVEYSKDSFEEYYRNWCQEHGKYTDGLCFP